MRKTLILLTLLVIIIGAAAQKKLPDYGEIALADLQLKNCSFEPEAPAMKLFDVQEVQFELYVYGHTRFKTERRTRIKIFNEKGYKYASVKIPFLSKRGYGKIKDLSGIVYNLDAEGKIVTEKLDKDDFFKEKAGGNIGIVNFTFPNLKPGSVIEFRYTTIEKEIMQLDPWIVQDEIPVAYTSNIIITPSLSRVVEKAYGIETIKPVVSMFGVGNARRKTVYSKENVISFQPEPFMSSQKDNLGKVVYLLFPYGNSIFSHESSPDVLWESTGSRFLRSAFFKEQIQTVIPGTEAIIDSAKKLLTTEDKISYVYETVKNRMPDKAEQSINATSLKEVWESREANSAEVNLILLNLLEKAGVNAYAMFISTRENGKVSKDFPSLGQLNGIDILAVDSNTYYVLDANLKFQSFKTPPLNILNREALLLSPDSIQWIAINDDRPLLKQNITVFAELNKNGVIEGTANYQHFDYARAYILDTTDTEEKEGDKKFLDKKIPGLTILSATQENKGNDREPLIETVEFTYELQQSDNFYFIAPQFLFSKRENPFIKEKRNTDIDFGCNQKLVFNIALMIPDSFEVDHLPKNTLVRAPDSSFSFKRMVSASGNSISFLQVFEVKRPVFEKGEYPGIQEFFKRMHALMAEEIVLKKKK